MQSRSGREVESGESADRTKEDTAAALSWGVKYSRLAGRCTSCNTGLPLASGECDQAMQLDWPV